MTEEERNLVLIDVAARLPYGVVCAMGKKEDALFTERLLPAGFNEFMSGNWNIKPYLRPLSSMTEEECKERIELFGKTYPLIIALFILIGSTRTI